MVLTSVEPTSNFSLFPYEKFQPAGDVPTIGVFLTDPYYSTVYRVPLCYRYSTKYSTRYQRHKALVSALLPSSYVPALGHKQTFREAFTNYQRKRNRGAATLVAAGVIDEEKLAVCSDASVILQVRALENWLSEAIRAGYHLSDS